MNLKLQKKLAAEILKVGEDRVWIDPTKIDKVKQAITRLDIKQLIKDGVIKKKKIRGQSRARANLLREKRKKGRRRGYGKRKGTRKAREGDKRVWINKIRALRKLLRWIKKQGKLDNKTWRDLYRKAKGGFFRNRAHLKLYVDKILGERQ